MSKRDFAKAAATLLLFMAAPLVYAKNAEPVTLEARTLESRRYDNVSEKQIAAACIATLQDMGFNLDSSDVELGYVTASKSWTPNLTKRTDTGLSATPDNALYQERYRVTITLRHGVSNEASTSPYYVVRAVFQESKLSPPSHSGGAPIVMNGKTLIDPSIYQDFFKRLSKSLFVEGQAL